MMFDADERLQDEDIEQSGLEESDNGSASYSGQNLYRRRKRRKEAERRKRKKEQETAKKIAIIAKRAVRGTTGSVAASVCGIMLLVVFCAIIMVASVAASPLGILFSNDAVSPGSIPLNAAIAQIQAEYTEWLGALQTGRYDRVELTGQPPDWREVVAVFACRTAGAEDGMEVTALDQARVDQLRAVFRAMTDISTEEETRRISSEDSNEIQEEHILYIRISSKTAEEMRLVYQFTDYQNEAMDVLLEELAGISSLLRYLQISQADALAVLNRLPENLSPERRAVVQQALTLVGKVNYFWGGKSLTLGWDERWGVTTLVTAPGSPTIGTYRPYGLDCSGFVDWVFFNATDGAYILSHSGGAASQHNYCTDIPWFEAQPGDLVFYPGDTHVGIVGGWDENGNLLIIHCSSGRNNVVITGAGGFSSVARPVYYQLS